MTIKEPMNPPADKPIYKHWHVERDNDAIVWLHIDVANNSANILSSGVLDELNEILEKLTYALPRGVIVLSDKPNGFVAGADVKEFVPLKETADALVLLRRGQRAMNRLAELKCPTVALIHGFCLGGGMELALACRYRIADEDPRTRLGLPEIKLGIHPGFGGTVRLPSLIGAPAAMDLMLTGKTIDARTAKKIGMVDYAVPARHLKRAAVAVIMKMPAPHRPTLLQSLTNKGVIRNILAGAMRHRVAEKAPGAHYPAPYALIDLWVKHAHDPAKMMEEEAISVARFVLGKTAHNLVRVFFLQERLKSLGKKTLIAPQHVHVIGGGVMGGDIAIWCALQGLRVTVQETRHDALAKVIKRAYALFKKRFKQPRLVQAAMDRLIPDDKGVGVGHADVVIEAIFEDILAKQALYREIEPKMKAGALLATNTSSIPLEILSEALAKPSRLVGIHFFNPVAQMQLVEVVSSPITDSMVARQAAAFVRHIDRLPLPVKSSPGFLVNRVLMPYLLEAVTMEWEGVPAAMIDKAALDFGMPMGPIRLADTVGLDICLSVAEILSQRLNVDVPPRLRELVSAGRLGVKSGQGFYTYHGDKPQIPRAKPGYTPPSDIAERLMLRLLNEAAACLREGVVADADLLDAGVIFGTGFAPFRGGPINYVQEAGVDIQRKKLHELEQHYGKRFVADAEWAEL
jgi:3-hydroxyacyl-CoA dehydrogenase/enoyl-CoA hydratase/3-hydroxybutyryl-CoA epimerase